DVGDKILKKLSELTKSFFRVDDVIIRYGGEEFIIIMNNIEYEQAFIKAEKFRVFIDECKLFSNDIHVTLSLGITRFSTNEFQDDVIKRADKALYIAKENGRNQVIEASYF
ncbi:MAG: GGDEF domain-containing protein, partial [Campylobacterales bacterium]|nr:GGDEF domain-containing protein [Campylobacterales bacterium]